MVTETVTAPRRLNLSLFGKQADFVADQHPFAAAVSGVGGGKSQGLAVKTLQYMANNPHAFGMITAPSFPMLRDATLRTVREIFPEGSYTFNEGKMSLRMWTGAEVVFRSTENPEHLRGPNLAFAAMDEAAQGTQTNPDAQYDAFLILQGRLRQKDMPHQLWIATTPQGYNWVYREFAAKVRPDYALYHWSARENPFLSPDFLRRLEESYQGEYALQEIEGQFVVTGGNAYFRQAPLLSMLDDCKEPVEVKLGGLVRVWRKPVVAAKYVAFGDVAWGEKGAYSCVVVADWQTGEQVAEIYGRPEHDELSLAIYSCCTEYNKAYLGIEANGEGINVVNKLIALGYGDRMYHHGEKWRQDERQRGWLTTGGTRPVMLGELEEAVRTRGIIPRCRDTVQEMMAFVRDEKGHPGPSAGVYADHVMAWAGLWQMRKNARYSVSSHKVGRLAMEGAGDQHTGAR